jgi:hypothetical protein
MDEQTKTSETTPENQIKRYTIKRDGDRPLSFRGQRIGEGNHGSGGSSGYECDWNRGVRVRIYRRAVGGYVVTWYHWSQWQGEGSSLRATICATAGDVVTALRDDEDGAIRQAEAEALADAAKVDDGLAAVSVEDLDAE